MARPEHGNAPRLPLHNPQRAPTANLRPGSRLPSTSMGHGSTDDDSDDTVCYPVAGTIGRAPSEGSLRARHSQGYPRLKDDAYLMTPPTRSMAAGPSNGEITETEADDSSVTSSPSSTPQQTPTTPVTTTKWPVQELPATPRQTPSPRPQPLQPRPLQLSRHRPNRSRIGPSSLSR